MMRAGGAASWRGSRGPRPGTGSLGGGSITSSVMVFLACLGTVYVGGRLWQDARLQKELVEARRSLQNKGQSKALSVEESIMKIEYGELQKREAMLQVELTEAKARGFVSIAAGAPEHNPARGEWILRTTTSSASSSSSSVPGRSNNASLSPSAAGRKGKAALTNKYLAVVGINTRFADRPLRDAIRASWLPSSPAALKKAEDQGLVFRFLVGHSPNRGDSSDRAITEENSVHKDFLILDDHEEDDHDMARKLKSFYAKAVRTWDAAFYVKMDDDVFVNIPGLVSVLQEYRARPRLYAGCMKSTEVVSDPNSRWYEPEWQKFGDGKMYIRHAAGPFHIITKELALYFAVARALLHEYKHEDVSLGAWMLGLDATYEDNRRLCCASAPEDECVKKREAGKPCVAVYDWHCGGLCEAEKRMSQVHSLCADTAGVGAIATG